MNYAKVRQAQFSIDPMPQDTRHPIWMRDPNGGADTVVAYLIEPDKLHDEYERFTIEFAGIGKKFSQHELSDLSGFINIAILSLTADDLQFKPWTADDLPKKEDIGKNEMLITSGEGDNTTVTRFTIDKDDDPYTKSTSVKIIQYTFDQVYGREIEDTTLDEDSVNVFLRYMRIRFDTGMYRDIETPDCGIGDFAVSTNNVKDAGIPEREVVSVSIDPNNTDISVDFTLDELHEMYSKILNTMYKLQ